MYPMKFPPDALPEPTPDTTQLVESAYPNYPVPLRLWGWVGGTRSNHADRAGTRGAAQATRPGWDDNPPTPDAVW